MPVLSEDQVNALAPDPNSAKAGLELANQRKWVSFGTDTNFVWGECQGSGRFPYQTIVDATELAFKCTCPSRKFPCKHGLGLLFLRARQAEAFVSSELPDWVKVWSDARQSRAEKKVAKKETAQPPDPVAKSKRQAERLAKVEAGLAEFRLWMQDRIRQGLAGLETQSYQYWENTAARLTDAQAPG
ncbi:MAG: SWIM zinc finger family protein, partial [Candidatus Obscuribacterales bacterium]|nr:SWIM zinc finger family protein [Candidatus Obscuribacterales bacterium]